MPFCQHNPIAIIIVTNALVSIKSNLWPSVNHLNWIASCPPGSYRNAYTVVWLLNSVTYFAMLSENPFKPTCMIRSFPSGEYCIFTRDLDLACIVADSAASHYNNVIMSAMASQITSLTIVYSTVYSGTDQRQRQSSESLAFVRRSQPWPVNSPHKGPVTQKMFSFDDVIMVIQSLLESIWRI